MLSRAVALEKEFEQVASDSRRPALVKRRDLARLLKTIFAEAADDLRERREHAVLRGEFVLDFADRADLGPKILENAFPVGNLNYAALIELMMAEKVEVEKYMPDIPLCWKPQA